MKFWIVMISVVAGIIWVVNSTRSDVKVFCAYGRVFVEFQDGHSTWGTILLDDDGLPIRCEDKDLKTKTNNLKDTI